MRLLAICLLSAAVTASAAIADGLPYAGFNDPTDRYRHGVLGDAIEFGALEIRIGFLNSPNPVVGRVELPDDRVFEDIYPRRAAISDQNFDDIVVVETQVELGAQLAVYKATGGFFSHDAQLQKIAATPHIGQPNRWLAPAGIADFDGDGQNDIAYVETPHLGKILKIVTLKGDQLVPIVRPLVGFSNHKIGQDFITSDVRQCDDQTELLTPNADWSALMAVRVEGGKIVAKKTPFEPSLDGIKTAQICH